MSRTTVEPEAPQPSWIPRIEALMSACGWTQVVAARKLGLPGAPLRGHAGLRRILLGGRPKVATLVRLKELEGAYEAEIEAWRGGLVGGPPGHRWDFRDAPSGTARPSDLTALATMAGTGAASGRPDGGGASRVVYFTPPARPWSKRYPKDGSGRPKTDRDGAAGVDSVDRTGAA